jgi:hypothetical protein
LRAIPSFVSSLDLSRNALGDKPQNELINILGAIPRSVASLNLSHNKFEKKTIKEFENISKSLPYVYKVCYNATPLPKENSALIAPKIVALNRYNGHGLKAIYQALTEHLNPELALMTLNFEFPYTIKEIKSILAKDSPPQEVPWFNKYSFGAFVALVSAAVEATILLVNVISIHSTLMWAIAVGSPIALGVLAGICFYLCCESKSMGTVLNP